MQQFINQMVDIIKSGVVMGGAHTPEDRDGAVLYYYENGEFYTGNAVNGGPHPTDEVITEADLRLRLEAHANSMSEAELAKDKAEVAAMHGTIAAREIPGVFMGDLSKQCEAQPINTQGMVVMTTQQAYDLLRLMDDASVDMWLDEDDYGEALDGVRALYNGLPRHLQKDIDELVIGEVATE